jgi:hypothetical protein
LVNLIGEKIMNIALTPDIEKALRERARKQGTSPEVLVLHVLRELFISSVATGTAQEKKGTLFDYLADHIGVLSSSEFVKGGARMSENCGKKFASGLLKKRQEKEL